jgi:hypothetical protein
MINGQFGQWIDEARQHWQSILSAGAFIKSALSVQELLRVAVIAIVTAVLTTWTTTVELKAEIRAINQAREAQIARRDKEISAMHARDEKLIERVQAIAEDVAIIKARMK